MFMLRVLFAVICVSFGSLLGAPIFLGQSDFDEGTYLIDQPGTYVLTENVSFNPNSSLVMKTDAYSSGLPLESQYKSKGGIYPDDAYGLGFFAAVAIAASDVTFDLNGFTLEQSAEHALLQRFFAIIELANQPFIPGQGPHNFGSQIVPASTVVIKNGTIGRSSHHGIHGNGNSNVEIRDIQFRGFEVAAVALNGVHGLLVEDCVAISREDVPVMGTFSSARFLKPYLDYLLRNKSQSSLHIGKTKVLGVEEAAERLRQGVNAVHEDLIVKRRDSIDSLQHPEEYALFHNPGKVVDGNCYGFLVNSLGQATGGFPVQGKIESDKLARNIRFKNVRLQHLKGKVNEIIALSKDGQAMTDPVGAVFQVMNLHPDTQQPITVSRNRKQHWVYKGNFLANAQALVAKAFLNGDFEGSDLDLSRLTISSDVLEWIESEPAEVDSDLAWLSPNRQNRLCNADSMFHVNKGVVGFKIDAAAGVELLRTTASNVVNLSEMGSNACGVYTKSHPDATLEGCGGPKTRGYTIAGSTGVRVDRCMARNIVANCGTAVGFDILTDSKDVVIRNALVDQVDAGSKYADNGGPNEPPKAIGFRVAAGASEVSLLDVCVRGLSAFDEAKPALDESGQATVQLHCR